LINALICFLNLAGIKAVFADSTTVCSSNNEKHDIKKHLFMAFDDSVVIRGTGYGTITDILNRLPGTFYFNRGHVGQKAFLTLFTNTIATQGLIYDGMIVNDPLTGKADFNLIPTESIDRIQIVGSSSERELGVYPLGGDIQFTSRDLAAYPIKSRVGYRTGGNGYDDIDVRLGVKISPLMSLNAGGLLKTYDGPAGNHAYDAQKINTAIERKLDDHTCLRYQLLFNKFDLDYLIPNNQSSQSDLNLIRPHQKDVRYDNLLSFSTSKVKTSLQWTDLHREFYEYRHTGVDQIHNLSRFFWNISYHSMVHDFNIEPGFSLNHIRMDSNAWGQHSIWDVKGGVKVSKVLNPRLLWGIRVDLQKIEAEQVSLLPETSFNLNLGKNWHAQCWASLYRYAPSLEALYTTGPFATGNQSLVPERHQNLGVIFEHLAADFYMFSGITWKAVHDEIAVAREESPLYKNFPKYNRISLDLAINIPLMRNVHFYLKGKGLFVRNPQTNHHPIRQPGYFALGCLKYSNVFFKGDLNAKISLGFQYTGTRYQSVRYYIKYDSHLVRIDPVIVPHVEASFQIKSATLFAAYENPLGVDYELLYGFEMPKTLLRWGFVWNFED
jgi:outer membrane cobalamin receptor